MVKVRTKILFAFLVLMLLCSVQAIAAVDGNDADLAINDDMDSNVKLGDDAELDGFEYLTAGEGPVLSDGSDDSKNVTVTVIWKFLTKDGPMNHTESYNISSNNPLTINQTYFNSKLPVNSVDYKGKTYVFTHWTDNNGNNITGDQTLYWAKEDYNVIYEAQYKIFSDCYIKIEFIVKNANGNVTITESNTIGYDGSWKINQTKFNDKIAKYGIFACDGKTYVFSHWRDEKGNNVIGNQSLLWDENWLYCALLCRL